MPLMTAEEKRSIIQASLAATSHEEEMAFLMRLPLEPRMALVARDVLGTEGLKNSRFDLSEANAEYGDDWLDK